MLKKLPKILIFLILAVFLVAGSAIAVPTTLYDILGPYDTDSIYEGTKGYYDTGAEYVFLTDTDGNNDNAVAYLFLEAAGFANTNTFGIYGFTMVDDKVVDGEMLEVFNGLKSPISSAALEFDIGAGTVKNSITNDISNIGTTFGFYLYCAEQDKFYYSHPELNEDDELDHMMIFDTSDHSVGMLFGSDVVVAIEDLWGGGDNDFNDMVVGVSDVAPAVPEPATMLLLGSGLIGLAAFGRKKFFKKS